MALTPNQEVAKQDVLAHVGLFGALGKHDGRQPAIHGNHLGWVRLAMVGTGLSWDDGEAPVDSLRNALMETWWGQSIWDLYNTDVPATQGWKSTEYGKRAPWWDIRDHEINATDRLLSYARNGQHASVAAVPGSWMSNRWPVSDTTPPPQTQEEWLRICRDELLHPDQYDSLRELLGLPAEEPPVPPVEPPVPPTDPGTPPVPEGLRERLIEAERSAVAAADMAEAAWLQSKVALGYVRAALAALEGA